MNRVWLALLASAVSGSAFAQGAVLYQPAKEIGDQGISIKSWGSGTISETDETAYTGTHSIRISTRNFFQGGLVNFGHPVDLNKDYLNKTNLLKITFKVATGGVQGGGGPGSGKGGGVGGPGVNGGGLAGGGGGGKGRGAGGQGGPGGPGGAGFNPGGFTGGRGPGPGGIGGPGGGASAGSTPVLKSMRLIITTTDGKKSEVYIPANTNSASDQGWTTLAVPLQAITGLDRTDKTIKSIGFAGNTTSTFYVGDLRIIDDTTPIRGEANTRDINAALGDEYTLTATGFGGSSILRYTWDFDDKDGIQVDAEGQSIKHKFQKAGTYIITLTISDYYGLKAPYQTTIRATLNP